MEPRLCSRSVRMLKGRPSCPLSSNGSTAIRSSCGSWPGASLHSVPTHRGMQTPPSCPRSMLSQTARTDSTPSWRAQRSSRCDACRLQVLPAPLPATPLSQSALGHGTVGHLPPHLSQRNTQRNATCPPGCRPDTRLDCPLCPPIERATIRLGPHIPPPVVVQPTTGARRGTMRAVQSSSFLLFVPFPGPDSEGPRCGEGRSLGRLVK